jgi:hypothetical protein
MLHVHVLIDVITLTISDETEQAGLAEAVEICRSILDVLGSNLGRDIGHLNTLSGFLSTSKHILD